MIWVNLGTYAAVSTVLATATVTKAFHDYPNFYSASIYLSQNYTASLIMGNFLLLIVFGITHVLQRLIYGPLRLIETEGIQQKLWVAVTEIALAMATFRDEFEASVLLMFSSLLSGKVWSWIASLRLDYFEQQSFMQSASADVRFLIGLGVLMLFAATMLRTCVDTILEEAKPGVVLMFTFEFALLALTTISILFRYLLDSRERKVLQTMRTAESSRLQARDLRRRQREATEQNVTVESIPAQHTNQEDLDVAWDQKPKWLFAIDAGTDIVRMAIYIVFFVVMTKFHGLPLHILRNMVLTANRVFKKVNGYIQFQRATQDMNSRYPDPTPGELENSNICIICRDEMQPWNHGPDPDDNSPRPERLRPKKLPCGHILHMSCLRTWLERQTVCPTCRQPALTNTATNGNRGANQNPRNLFHQFGFGPFRLMVGNVNPAEVQNLVNRIRRDGERGRADRPTAAAQPPTANTPQPPPTVPTDLTNNEQPTTAVRIEIENIIRQARDNLARPTGAINNSTRTQSPSRNPGVGVSIDRMLASRSRRSRTDVLDSAIGRSLPMSIQDREEFLSFLERDVRETIVDLQTQQKQLQTVRRLHEQAKFESSELDRLQEGNSNTLGTSSSSAQNINGTVKPEFDPNSQSIDPGIIVPPGWKIVPLHSMDYTAPISITGSTSQSTNFNPLSSQLTSNAKGKESVNSENSKGPLSERDISEMTASGTGPSTPARVTVSGSIFAQNPYSSYPSTTTSAFASAQHPATQNLRDRQYSVRPSEGEPRRPFSFAPTNSVGANGLAQPGNRSSSGLPHQEEQENGMTRSEPADKTAATSTHPGSTALNQDQRRSENSPSHSHGGNPYSPTVEDEN